MSSEVRIAYTESLAECRELMVAGGKAVNLGRLMGAGFRVPEGFVVTTRAHRDGNGEMELIEKEIRERYRAMGGGAVAVRSSATAEDMAGASMAGQYETFLDVNGEEAVVAAVKRCWGSADTARTRAYLEVHGVDLARVAMAVVVQKLVPAEVAGVLFTANPHSGGVREMLIEASWGLGESVVSGRVQPDVVRVEAATGKVLSEKIADKQVWLGAGAGEEREVEEELRRKACLTAEDVRKLWEVGRRAAEHFGMPQDVEWAISQGELFVLQSRPITTLGDVEAYEEALAATREHLRSEGVKGRGPWVMHNLGETLGHPTPLTWSVIKTFMSGAGGYGEMYRRVGFDPSAEMKREGFLELIAGRIYMDAERAPEMFYEGFPFKYDTELLKRSADAGEAPPTMAKGKWSERSRAMRVLRRVNEQLAEMSKDFHHQLRETLFPNIASYVAAAKEVKLAGLEVEQLIERWEEYEEQVLGSMGSQLLVPSMICALAMGKLAAFVWEHFWEEDAEALAQVISSGGPGNMTLAADAELFEVGQRRATLARWIQLHGHRASGEFDLVVARWRERPEEVRAMAARLAAGDDPAVRHRKHVEAVERRVEALRAKLGRPERAEFDRRIETVRTYVAFREDAKDYLMLGYDLLRDVALEMGRRLRIGAEVFYLTREEVIQALRVGAAPVEVMGKRKRAYEAEIRIKLPRVIDAVAVEGLGTVIPVERNGEGHEALGISQGEATGRRRIVKSPSEAGEMGCGYILVCSSTDPSWTPLFVNAAGLVLERGGALSHGAVVARELGLPAVVLPEATRLLKEGEEIFVDGLRGWVGPSGKAKGAGKGAVDPQDVRVAHGLVPPPVGAKERWAGTLRNVMAGVWGVYLIGFFVSPGVRDWTMGVLDSFLWPVVRGVGKPGAVAVIAGGIALLTLILQKFFTDNGRLLEAKRRAGLLMKEAKGLPKESGRYRVLTRMAGGVQMRTLLAAMVPVGMLLGPLVMPFVWLGERVDPAAWNAPAGSVVRVVAMVEGEFGEEVMLDVPARMRLDEMTPRSQTLPAIRGTLERLLALYREPARSGPVWELALAPGGGKAADDLAAYLKAGIPARAVMWTLRPAEDADGRFIVNVRAGESHVAAKVVLGDEFPPGARTVVGGKVVREVRVVYPSAKVEPVFWQPFGWMSIGWLWEYVMVYVPVLLVARWLMRIA